MLLSRRSFGTGLGNLQGTFQNECGQISDKLSAHRCGILDGTFEGEGTGMTHKDKSRVVEESGR